VNGVIELWNSWKENERIISKAQDDNKHIGEKFLTFFTNAWEKKHGKPFKGSCLGIRSYDPSDRFIFDRKIEKGEDAVEIIFMEKDEDYDYDSTVIPLKAFSEEELDPEYLVTREDTRRLKEEESRLKEEREEYERLKKKYDKEKSNG
jgi:hypothetical protein